MIKEFLSLRLAPLGVLVVLAVALTSCGVEPFTGRPRVWIDVPRDGAEVNADTAVSVISHAYAREGVAEIMLSVNGEPYTREPPAAPGEPFTQITQQWFPAGPGAFVLQVRAYDTQGQMSNAATVRVTVLGEPPGLILTPGEVPTATHTPTGVPTDTPTSTGVPTDTPTSTGVPTDTPTSTPTGTATTLPRPTILRLSANPPSIERGQCARLTWEVAGNPTAIYLDGEGVGNAPDFRDKCPTSTTTYTLRAVGPGGEATATIQVEVRQPPQDTQGPNISGVQQSTGEVCTGGCCGPVPTSVDISARITDDSGVGDVRLYCTVRDSGGAVVQSEYHCGDLTQQGPRWAITYVPSSNLTNHTISYRIQAIDNSPGRNLSWSGTGSFKVGHRLC